MNIYLFPTELEAKAFRALCPSAEVVISGVGMVATAAAIASLDRRKHLLANDVVKVVRCKDCKYYWLPQGFCTHDRHDHQTMAVWQEDDDFCSYGERRE
jgi:hypothetical protein